jgi:hypothetical protein
VWWDHPFRASAGPNGADATDGSQGRLARAPDQGQLHRAGTAARSLLPHALRAAAARRCAVGAGRAACARYRASGRQACPLTWAPPQLLRLPVDQCLDPEFVLQEMRDADSKGTPSVRAGAGRESAQSCSPTLIEPASTQMPHRSCRPRASARWCPRCSRSRGAWSCARLMGKGSSLTRRVAARAGRSTSPAASATLVRPLSRRPRAITPPRTAAVRDKEAKLVLARCAAPACALRRVADVRRVRVLGRVARELAALGFAADASYRNLASSRAAMLWRLHQGRAYARVCSANALPPSHARSLLTLFAACPGHKAEWQKSRMAPSRGFVRTAHRIALLTHGRLTRMTCSSAASAARQHCPSSASAPPSTSRSPCCGCAKLPRTRTAPFLRRPVARAAERRHHGPRGVHVVARLSLRAASERARVGAIPGARERY